MEPMNLQDVETKRAELLSRRTELIGKIDTRPKPLNVDQAISALDEVAEIARKNGEEAEAKRKQVYGNEVRKTTLLPYARNI